MTARTPAPVVYMPSTMSYRQPAVQRRGTSRPSGLEALIASAVRYLYALPRRLAVKSELQRLTDRELNDIGLTRAEIKTVFERTR